MKAISLHPDNAMNVAEGRKWIETRPRRCNYRGPIAIQATLPVGAVVASAVLVDCAPIGGPYDFRTGYVEGDEGDYPDQAVVVHHPPMGPMGAYLGLSNADTSTTDITDQLPYGDFTPGRWALILHDVEPTFARCPVCWGSGGNGFGTWCHVCLGREVCDPIPAKGQQAVPWEWTP